MTSRLGALIVALSLLGVATSARAQTSLGGQRAGTSAGTFLKIGVGARPVGMGEAFVAVANDPSTIYWNPAGLAGLQRKEVTASHVDWPADVSYDFVAAVPGMNLLQFGGRSLRGFFPGNGIEFTAFAQQRLLDAFWMRGEIKSEAALHTQEFLVNAGKVTIVGAHDFVIAHAESGLAAVGTMRADGGDIFHLPRPSFVAIGAAGERAYRADIDAHAAFFAIEMIAFIGNDDGVRAAHAHA